MKKYKRNLKRISGWRATAARPTAIISKRIQVRATKLRSPIIDPAHNFGKAHRACFARVIHIATELHIFLKLAGILALTYYTWGYSWHIYIYHSLFNCLAYLIA